MPEDATRSPDVPGLLIDNVWPDGTGTEPMTITAPYGGETLATIAESSPADVDAAVASAQKACEAGGLAPYDRYRILRRTAELIEARREELSPSIVAEAGKPVRDARAEVSRAVLTFELCAEEAKRIGGESLPVDATPGSENRHVFTFRRPAGVVCAITPFNGPVIQLSHKVPTAIAAGAGVVLRPLEITPLSAIALAQILLDAGLPPGHLNMVQGQGETVGPQLLAGSRFAVHTLTGSTPVGLRIRRTVGLRKTLLELGNNSADIVHADADLALAARRLARWLPSSRTRPAPATRCARKRSPRSRPWSGTPTSARPSPSPTAPSTGYRRVSSAAASMWPWLPASGRRRGASSATTPPTTGTCRAGVRYAIEETTEPPLVVFNVQPPRPVG
jgi:acyl-CoA reductase-like NAD-dependent aldehyde dehydrogenase